MGRKVRGGMKAAGGEGNSDSGDELPPILEKVDLKEKKDDDEEVKEIKEIDLNVKLLIT